MAQPLPQRGENFVRALAGGADDEDETELVKVLLIQTGEFGPGRFGRRPGSALLLLRPVRAATVTDLGMGGKGLQPILNRQLRGDLIGGLKQMPQMAERPLRRHFTGPAGRSAASSKARLGLLFMIQLIQSAANDNAGGRGRNRAVEIDGASAQDRPLHDALQREPGIGRERMAVFDGAVRIYSAFGIEEDEVCVGTGDDRALAAGEPG